MLCSFHNNVGITSAADASHLSFFVPAFTFIIIFIFIFPTLLTLTKFMIMSLSLSMFYGCEETQWPSKLLQRKHGIGTCLQFQVLCALSSWQGAGWHTGRHGSREAAESSTSSSRGSKKKVRATGLDWAFKTPKPTPSFSNWATSTPEGHILPQVVPFPNGHAFKHMSLWERVLFKPPQRSCYCIASCQVNEELHQIHLQHHYLLITRMSFPIHLQIQLSKIPIVPQ